MKNVFLIILISLCGNIYSQNNKRSIDTTREVIHNKRSLLVFKLGIKDTTNFGLIFSFLKTKENKEYISLYPVERWLLDYCLGDYNDILQTVLTIDSTYFSSFKFRTHPQFDSLEFKLAIYTESIKVSIFKRIDSSSYDQEKKDFLKLNLRFCLFDRKKPIIFQDTLNLYANRFIQQYQTSENRRFIQKIVYAKYIPSKFAITLDGGFGIGNYTNGLSNYFGQNGFASLGIELAYKKFNFNYRYQGGSARVKKEFVVNNVSWKDNVRLNVALHEFSISYNLLDLRFFRAIPFSGISIFKLDPYPEIKNSRILTSLYAIGLTCDFKYRLHKFDSFYGALNNNYGLIRLRYAYNFPLKDFNGNIGYMNYLTLGWGFTFRGVTRAN